MTLEGYELIKHFEGCKLKAYKCPAGIWTIGYGNTRYTNGDKVKEGDKITQEEANALFQRTVDKFEYQVKLLLGNELCTKLHPHSLSALVSFAYNCGITTFGKSTLLRLIRENKNNLKDIYIQFKRWNKANGEVLNGLTTRREAEYALYERGVLSQYSKQEQEKMFSKQFKCNFK